MKRKYNISTSIINLTWSVILSKTPKDILSFIYKLQHIKLAIIRNFLPLFLFYFVLYFVFCKRHFYQNLLFVVGTKLYKLKRNSL